MNKVQVFYSAIKDFSKEEFCFLVSKLPEIKQKSIERLLNQNDKNASLSAYLLLKQVLLENRLNIDAYEYVVGEYGKPSLSGCPIKFSLSHSGQICVVAISKKDVGVDIEEVRNRSLKVQKIFTDKDREYIAKSDDELLAFHQIWTAKESYVKAIGTGLSTPFNSFEVVDAPAKHLMSFKLDESYVGSVYSLEPTEFANPVEMKI